jgi:hypothetical protein
VNAPEVLTLSDADQLTLAGTLLLMMEIDLKAEDDDARRRGRNAIRNQLRYLVRRTVDDGRPGHEPLEIENDDVLQARIESVESEAHGIALQVEAACFQPWNTPALQKSRRGDLNEDKRKAVIDWVSAFLPGTTPAAGEVDRHVFGSPALRRAKLVALGLGVAALGAAGASVAAPVIGTAIGGAMGLSGVAATNAGLAWLGGGALAAGGYGMAGGTVLLGAVGAVGGGGLGAFVADQTDKRSKAQVELETRKLGALIRLCVADVRAATTIRVGREQQLVLEAEIARVINARVTKSVEAGAIASELDAELRELGALRQYVAVDSFELEPKRPRNRWARPYVCCRSTEVGSGALRTPSYSPIWRASSMVRSRTGSM